MKIACLHTADVHVETFDALFDRAGFEGVVDHLVRSDLLVRARDRGLAAVRADLRQAVSGMGAPDALLCTCSTLGPLIDEMAQQEPHLLRIDRPLMEVAVAAGERVLLVLCLDSTRAASVELFHGIAAEAGRPVQAQVLLCRDAWPLFEAGRSEDFARTIAGQVERALAQTPDLQVVVLAQASMMGATDHLADLGVPVLSSPAVAVDRAIGIARS